MTRRAQAEHGTYSMYTNQRCRCADCRAANTAYNLGARERRSGTIPEDSERHGRYSTYINYRCRCGACRAANNACAARARQRQAAS